MRYFIISYIANTDSGIRYGVTDYQSNEFVNRELYKDRMVAEQGVLSITILNIMELSKDDFEEFISV